MKTIGGEDILLWKIIWNPTQQKDAHNDEVRVQLHFIDNGTTESICRDLMLYYPITKVQVRREKGKNINTSSLVLEVGIVEVG